MRSDNRTPNGVQSLTRAGQAECFIRLDLRQLLARHRPVCQERPQILVHFSQRFLRLIRLHGRKDEEWPLRLSTHKEAVCAVGPVLVLSQVHVQARAERSANVIVHGLDGDFLRGVGRHCGMAGEDQRLAGARLVHQVNHRLGRKLDRRHVLPRNLPWFPPAKQLLQLGSNFGQRRVTHDDQRRVVWPIPCLMKLHQIVARHFLHAGGGARAGQRRCRTRGQVHRAVWGRPARPSKTALFVPARSHRVAASVPA